MKLYKHIPNFITSMNLLSGVLSIIYIFSGDYRIAVLLIFLAAIFDFFDGMSARALKAYSEIGKELDSLADIVSFGLAPSLLLYHLLSGVEGLHLAIKFIPLMVAVFSALRLAKFNVDSEQKVDFMGLPTPAAGLLIASLVYFYASSPQIEWLTKIMESCYFIPILSVVISWLLVSKIPMFSMKMKDFSWKSNKIRYIYLITVSISAIIVALTGVNWSLIPLSAFILYILMNLLLKITDNN